MRILYIFPHPDDESFGPARAMSKQRREGHEVYLLTLTKGGATRQRHKYGYSIDEMGAVRYREMQNVAKVLHLSGMIVLDFPDSGLKELDPREMEEAIINEIERIQPKVVVTYPAHGISGFHDHLVIHAVVKHGFVQLKERVPYLKRLAFYTITEEEAKQSDYFPLSGSTSEEIDCVIRVDDIDIGNTQRALECYLTFQETITNTGIKNRMHKQVVFEIFQERHDPPLANLFAKLS